MEALTHEVELILVVGSANSSNSNRLVEVAKRAGVAARLIEDANDIDASWAGRRHDVGTYGGSFGAGGSGGAGEPATFETRIYEPARPGPDSRGCALYAAGGTGGPSIVRVPNGAVISVFGACFFGAYLKIPRSD